MITGIIPKQAFSTLEDLPIIKTNRYFLKIADDLVLSFLSDLSKRILRESLFKTEPSFFALAFWLRKSNIKRILNENIRTSNFALKPLGKVFHLCPSNVDTMFIYSLVLALLGGNKNVVRISAKLENSFIIRLFALFNGLLKKEKYQPLIEYINVVTYPHSDDLNEKISLAVNGRIIWGGDKTVDQFKKYATKPKVKDLYFNDKVSLCIINIEDEDKFNQHFDQLIKNLYNDIYPFHQKGCSSPHSLFVISRTANKPQTLQKIYDRLSKMACKKYPEDISSIASLKLNQSVVDIIEDKVVETIHNSNYLTFAGMKSDEVPHSCGAGYLYYKFANHLSDIKSSINPKTQTITYWGLSKDQVYSFLETLDVETVDRVVPIGQALDFDYIWDGYNIFLEMLSFKSIK